MNTIQILTVFLAQAEPTGPSPLIQFLPFILLMAGFWFLLIQPQRKKQKEHEKMITEIKVGDKIVTSGGICGTVTMVKSNRFQVKVDDNCRIEVIKSFVSARDSSAE
ncbi:MAG: preprotein translocase subunit YajC [Verrucomicrobia bacterium]|nr:preprotein translocase subunit YajC [Verrucomicrobiota bacterium]